MYAKRTCTPLTSVRITGRPYHRHAGPRSRPTGYEFSEVAHPYDELTGRGWTVDFASPLGGRPPEDGYDERDPASRAFRDGVGFARLGESLRLDEVDDSAYAAVFFPGGLGPMIDLAESPRVKALAARFYDSGRIVAAVCHGPAALLRVRLGNGSLLLGGRRVTSFTTAEEEGHSKDDVPFLLDDVFCREGAVFSHAPPFAAHVGEDGLVVTGQNPASARGVAIAIDRIATARASSPRG